MSNSNPQARLQNAEIFLTELLLTKSSDEEIFEAWDLVAHYRRVVKNIADYEKGVFEINDV